MLKNKSFSPKNKTLKFIILKLSELKFFSF